MVECSSFTLWDLRAPFCIGWLMSTFSTKCGPYWRKGSYLRAILSHHCRGRCSSVPSAIEFQCKIREPSGKILTFTTPVAGHPLRGFYATCK